MFEFSVYPSIINNTDKEEEILWSRDSGFSKDVPLRECMHPFRSFGTNYLLSMHVIVEGSRSDFTISIHAPDEVPQFDRHSEIVSIAPGHNNYIEISPHLVVSEGIKHYAPDQRQCYYTDERQLQFYKQYTKNHCETECLTNYVLEKCGCVPYSLPRTYNTQCSCSCRC